MRRCECGEVLNKGRCARCDALRKPAARGRLHREGRREPRREVLLTPAEISRGMLAAGVPPVSSELPRYVWRRS